MGLKLFVADDSITIQKVIGLAFSESGTVIRSVTNGDEALEAIRAFGPDVVLADVCMPGVTGYEICRHIKGQPGLAHVPVVLLVGTFETFDEQEASRAGYDACLTKPFDTAELLDVVRKLVGRNIMSLDKESDAIVHSGAPGDNNAASVVPESAGNKRIPVSRRSLDSFLGSNRVLDVFEAGTEAKAKKKMQPGGEPDGAAPSPPPSTVNMQETVVPHVPAEDRISEELLDAIAERVVKKMSAEVISEIAWEVVPELSEIIIRRTIEESRKS